MQKLHSPYIRIEISEVVEHPGDASHRETRYNLHTVEFQTREQAQRWMNERSKIGLKHIGEDLADAVNIT